jgi:glycosyltransferase involved in cell wall biosynthesis
VLVRRFPIEPHDRERHLAALDALRRDGLTAELEAAYLSSSLHSQALIEALADRGQEFDAIVVGPYLFGLTWRVAQCFGAKVLLLPCFHDEPFARFRSFQQTYSEVGGLLYHTAAEQWFAQAELGINHPNAAVIGALLESSGEAPEGGATSAAEPPYSLVYCGRYSVEKGVDRLLKFAQRYANEHPGRFRFVFMGQGSLTLPRAPWLVNRGFVSEVEKQREIARAHALIQLSTNESLSLVALEAWDAGVPVIGHRDCRAVREQIGKSQGGLAIADYAEFASALDSLWQEPERWQQMGQDGQRFVQAEYTSLEAFGRRILDAVEGLSVPLREQMRQQGLARARRFDVPVWQARWLELLVPLLEAPRQRMPFNLRVDMPSGTRRVAPSAGDVLVPVKIHNVGAWPASSTGPCPARLECVVVDERGQRIRGQRPVALPSLLRPGATLLAVIPVPVPTNCGHYRVHIGAGMTSRARVRRALRSKPLDLVVSTAVDRVGTQVADPFLASAQRALAEAHALKKLPDDYRDVTQGRLAKWKRAIKQKLLHQFRRSYVDVLSRQQSAFNEKLLVALCELADGLAALSQVAAPQGDSAQLREVRQLLRGALRENRRVFRRVQEWEKRLASIEASLPSLARLPHEIEEESDT